MQTKDIEEVYPMSDIQKGMVSLSQIYQETSIYHDQFIYHLPSLDLDRFKKALALLVEKHPILRTQFDLYKYSQEVQIVLSGIEVEIAVFDLKDLDDDLQEKHIKKYLVEERKTPFDINTAGLWRASVFHSKTDRDIFVFQFHHAILDGWSIASLNTELLSVYMTLETDENFKPQKLKSSVKDAIVQELVQKKNDKVKAFWKEELEQYKKMDVFSKELANKQYKVNYTGHALIEKCKKDKILPQTVFLGAYLYALNMLSYENEVMVGLVCNTRLGVEDGDKVLGCFLNTLPLKINKYFFDEKPYLSYLKLVEEKVTLVRKNSRLTLAAIAKATEKKKGHKNPFFDILFNYNDFHVYDNIYANGKDDFKEEHFENTLNLESFEATNTKLDLIVSRENDSFNFWYRLSHELDAKQSLAQFHKYLLRFMDQYTSATATNTLIHSKDIIPVDILHRLNDFNATHISYPKEKTVIDLFYKQVQQNAEATAVEYGATRLSFQELDQLSSQLSNYLVQQYEIGTEDLVALCLERSEWMLISILAILKAGAAYLPMDVDYPKERMDYIRQDSKYKVCINEEELNTFKAFDKAKIKSAPKVIIRPNQLAYAIYTSGSTGVPKGVLNQHDGLYNRLLWMQADLGIHSKDIIFQKTPYTFDVSVWELLMPLVAGCKVVFAAQGGHKDPQYLKSTIGEKQISLMHFVPSMLDTFLAVIENEKLPSLRAVVCSGEALTSQLIEQFKKKLSKIQLHNYYGPTEAGIDVTAINLTDFDTTQTEVPIGQPVANTQIYIVDKSMNQQPIGVRGELLIGGIQVSRGYLNRHELNKEKFIHSPFVDGMRLYRTGDLAKWLPDGNIAFLGRIDNQVKIRGNRIELGEIIYHLQSHKEVSNAVVIAVPNQREQLELVAYVVASEDLTIQDLRSFLNEKMPAYMVPAQYIRLEEIPLSPNGKVDHKSLRTLKKNTLESAVVYAAPRNSIEQQIINVLEELIDYRPISINDRFSDIGIDSLDAIKVIAKLNKLFEVRLALKDFFDYETTSQLGERIFLNNSLLGKQENAILRLLSGNADQATTVFAIPGGAGDATCFHGLASRMENLNIYGFDFHGRTNNREILGSVEEVAADYILEMKKIQAVGPYTICAYCLGAKIAFEMVIQLQEVGEIVEQLILLDGLAPERFLDVTEGRFELLYGLIHGIFSFLGKEHKLTLDEFKLLSEEDQINYVYDSLDSSFQTEMSREEIRKYIDIRMNSFYLSQNYKPDFDKRIKGDVTFFRLADSDPQDLKSWAHFAENDLNIKWVPCGTHETFITDEKAVASIALDMIPLFNLPEYSI